MHPQKKKKKQYSTLIDSNLGGFHRHPYFKTNLQQLKEVHYTKRRYCFVNPK